MTLQEQLNAYKRDSNHQLPIEAQTLLDTHIVQLKQSSINYGLNVGLKAPDFTFPSDIDKSDHLYNHLKDGPVVLTFIRGNWCTYCNLQLKAYEAMIPKLTTTGAKLLVVSMQADDNTYGNFQLIEDTNGSIAQSYKVLYPIEAELAQIYKDLNVDLGLENRCGQWHLPITATYIIDQKALIRHTFIDADYKNRMDPESIMAILNVIS